MVVGFALQQSGLFASFQLSQMGSYLQAPSSMNITYLPTSQRMKKLMGRMDHIIQQLAPDTMVIARVAMKRQIKIF
ncbi:hypothetical protein FGO68_gene11855 [Halteria grandinella]|uniref:Uncharacterized protein n=1 Tax=Halteria grandinella TaxID=5974 RepID=A0A8J8P006_HALGN|nr:hypothetical protein FGO68_gene11855 [Halteria grandinella]